MMPLFTLNFSLYTDVAIASDVIDDVRIYNYARTAEQVMQDYNAGAAARLGD